MTPTATRSRPHSGLFEADVAGMRRIAMRRGAAWLLYELIQNCWDEAVTEVSVLLKSLPSVARAHLVVTDDAPDGFRDLRHAWTLYAESPERGDL